MILRETALPPKFQQKNGCHSRPRNLLVPRPSIIGCANQGRIKPDITGMRGWTAPAPATASRPGKRSSLTFNERCVSARQILDTVIIPNWGKIAASWGVIALPVLMLLHRTCNSAAQAAIRAAVIGVPSSTSVTAVGSEKEWTIFPCIASSAVGCNIAIANKKEAKRTPRISNSNFKGSEYFTRTLLKEVC